MDLPSIAWISHPDCLSHDVGDWHPECPQRLSAIEARIQASPINSGLKRLEAPLVAREALEQVHARAHVERLWAADPQHRALRLDPDTYMGTGSLAAARRGAGAGLLAVDTVLGDEHSLAFCAVRPPGHHAERDRAMGFCLFNSVAVAAAYALGRGIDRVGIVDFDVHYGNGTSRIFAGDPRVQVYSTYQDGLYPYWGGSSAANLIDIPLKDAAGGSAFRSAVETRLLPALDAFRPQLLLVSAGFDAHAEDPLGGLRLTDPDFQWIGTQLARAAARHGQSRLIATLEGGYNLEVLGGSVESFLRGMRGEVP